jgi:serine/threonine protein phosphatase PrpC
MIKSSRRLSKPLGYYCLPSSQQYPFVIKGCAIFSLTLVIYLNYRFDAILYDTAYTDGNVLSKSDIEFQSLRPFPNNLLTTQSTIQEWEQQTETPMIGFYRYSSTATIQLPTADLEEPRPKQIQEKGFHPDGGLSNNGDVVVLTRKGHKFNPEDRKRTPNQDRVLVLSRRDDTIHGENIGNNDWWMGLFDGHGNYGHAVSQYVSSEFVRRINTEWEDENSSRSSKVASSNKKSSTAVKDVLRAIFLEINHSIPSFMRSAGSTGISVLKRGDSLYISNLGDSVAFVASYNKTHNSQSGLEIIYSAKPHKPDTPSERKRIEEKGGRVQDPAFKGSSARLIIPVKVGFQTFEVGLAMSRSFGDHDGIKVGLSAEPDTDVLDLSKFDKNKDYIVVAVTDGLVDFGRLSEEEVALAMAKALSTEENQTNKLRRLVSAQGTEAASKLILKSSQMWDSEFGNYRDDISIVAHKLRL